jgi:hypothetical protein
MHRCRAALKGGGSGLQVEDVVLPDGEQHKSLEVLQQVGTHSWPHAAPLAGPAAALHAGACTA